MQPQSPSPDRPYDFIFKEGQKPKRSLVPNMSGPVLVLVTIVVLMILTVIASTLFLGKNKTSTSGLTAVLGQAQEIGRVNILEQPLLKDPTTIDMLATSQAALTSEQNEINTYAKAHKIKIDSKKLAAYKNTQTDAVLATAAQNNNLDSAYTTYLKQALNNYSTSIVNAFQTYKQTDLKLILKGAYNSTQTLLGNPPKAT